MNTGIVGSAQRRLFAVVFAAALALTVFAAPMAIDQLAGTSLTPSAAACHASSGGGC